jgi:hypothetical protein
VTERRCSASGYYCRAAVGVSTSFNTGLGVKLKYSDLSTYHILTASKPSSCGWIAPVHGNFGYRRDHR